MKNLFKALAEFQQEVPVIHKATQGYGYSYADLPKIFEVINPLLQKHGLGFTQLINTKEGQNYLTTCVFHIESGEIIESQTLIPYVQLKGMNDFQSFGSGVTYFRRYALSSALGLVTDKDTDAAGEQENTTQTVSIKKIVEEAKKPQKNEKQKLNDEHFQKAIAAIQKGTYSVDELKARFILNEVQEKALLLV